jgi:hypothetical protein
VKTTTKDSEAMKQHQLSLLVFGVTKTMQLCDIEPEQVLHAVSTFPAHDCIGNLAKQDILFRIPDISLIK